MGDPIYETERRHKYCASLEAFNRQKAEIERLLATLVQISNALGRKTLPEKYYWLGQAIYDARRLINITNPSAASPERQDTTGTGDSDVD